MTGWSDTGSPVTGPLPSMGCDLPRHVRRVSRSGQCTSSNSRSDELAEVRLRHSRRRLHPYYDRDIGNLGRAVLSPRRGNRPPTGNCGPWTTFNSVSTSAFFGGNSTWQRLLRDGDISASDSAVTEIWNDSKFNNNNNNNSNNNLFVCVASWAITLDVATQLAC